MSVPKENHPHATCGLRIADDKGPLEAEAGGGLENGDGEVSGTDRASHEPACDYYRQSVSHGLFSVRTLKLKFAGCLSHQNNNSLR